jgi:hypothetical protein
MARRGWATEHYIEITGENVAPGSGVRVGLQGTTAPGGDGDEQDAASKGSLYHNTSTGDVYKKIGSANTAADWLALGDVTIDELHWRNEKVQAATNDTLSAGAGQDPTSWSDNESGTDATNWSVGDYVLGDVDGTPALWEITAKASATSITLAAASLPLADNDTFVVQSYFPDTGAGDELQAIVHFPLASGPGIKIADVNWQNAAYIDLDAGYSATNGTLSSADSVNSAIEKLDGNQQDIQTTLGVAQGSTNLGAFSSPGSLIALATYTIKQAFQQIFDLFTRVACYETTGVTTQTTVDSVLVDNVKAIKWFVTVFETASQANCESFEILAMHDGVEGGADAANVDYNNPSNKLKLGSGVAGLDVDVDLNGTGASQALRLLIGATNSSTIRVRRLEIRKDTV